MFQNLFERRSDQISIKLPAIFSHKTGSSFYKVSEQAFLLLLQSVGFEQPSRFNRGIVYSNVSVCYLNRRSSTGIMREP